MLDFCTLAALIKVLELYLKWQERKMRIKTKACFTPGIASEPKLVVITTNRPMNTFVIYPGDFVQLYAKDVTFEARSERGTVL
jgi:hypothetical protein